MRARSTPEEAADPIIAIPARHHGCDVWKSTLIGGNVVISEIPATAFFSTLSAAENASSSTRRRPDSRASVENHMTESTCWTAPLSQLADCRRRRLDEKAVNHGDGRNPSLGDLRTTGAAPVRAPPIPP